MKRICILTATRAEYGLLKNLILKLSGETKFEVDVVATGAHLAPEYGLTFKEIEQDGIRIDRKIPILLSSDLPASMSKTMGLALIAFSDYFEEKKPDMLIVLGDRYETLAVCIAAMNQRIPIAHLHGGEKTEGAIDEAIRHAITKLSYLHFTSTEEYRKRVIQLGEQPDRVFCVGAMGVENILNQPFMTKEELETSIGFELGESFAIVTYHPVTLETEAAAGQVQELLTALLRFENMKYIITKANADAGGREINRLLDRFAEENKERVFVIESLGMKRYLSALKWCRMVIGNSSSGIVEAPSFHIPTVNIGDRQKGRLQTESVINCATDAASIEEAMHKAMGSRMREIAAKAINPYGQGNTSEQVVSVIKKTLLKEGIQLKKSFFDVDFHLNRYRGKQV